MGMLYGVDMQEVPAPSSADITSNLISWAAELCARLGETSLVIFKHWLGDSKEPYEGNLHVRDCGGSAGQPVLLPGCRSKFDRQKRELTTTGVKP